MTSKTQNNTSRMRRIALGFGDTNGTEADK
jgi:hypothetical protein